MTKTLAKLVAVTAFWGCASMPDVKLTYYPATWKTTATVVQTIACSTSKQSLVILHAPTIATAYSSDRTAPKTIEFQRLSGPVSDADIKVVLTEDGRLKSINQSSTGQGEAVVTAAVKLASAVFVMGAKPVAPPPQHCDEIEDLGKGKPLTLTYRAILEASDAGTTVDFHPTADSSELYAALRADLPKLTADVAAVTETRGGPAYTPPAKGGSRFVLLPIQTVGSVAVTVRSDAREIGSAQIVVPQNKYNDLPIPKAALFGKQTFSLEVAESGAVTSVGYGRNAGVAGALSGLASIAGTQTPATRAAELKAEADLIVQQQRLALCKAKPAECK